MLLCGHDLLSFVRNFPIGLYVSLRLSRLICEGESAKYSWQFLRYLCRYSLEKLPCEQLPGYIFEFNATLRRMADSAVYALEWTGRVYIGYAMWINEMNERSATL